jgi:phosphomevalonate kinase
MLCHKHVQVALILHPSCVPEKMVVNQEGVNRNVIPIKYNELGREGLGATIPVIFSFTHGIYIYIHTTHTHTHIAYYIIIVLLVLILYRDKQYSL